ncbi:hypothetical protein D3C72_1663680 [compost metagenome]
MKSPRLPRPRHCAGPDVQAVLLLAVQLQLLEPFLHPLPIAHLILLGKESGLGMFLGIALEHTGTDQIDGIGDRMHQCLGVIDDERACFDAPTQPGNKMLA